MPSLFTSNSCRQHQAVCVRELCTGLIVTHPGYSLLPRLNKRWRTFRINFAIEQFSSLMSPWYTVEWTRRADESTNHLHAIRAIEHEWRSCEVDEVHCRSIKSGVVTSGSRFWMWN